MGERCVVFDVGTMYEGKIDKTFFHYRQNTFSFYFLFFIIFYKIILSMNSDGTNNPLKRNNCVIFVVSIAALFVLTPDSSTFSLVF